MELLKFLKFGSLVVLFDLLRIKIIVWQFSYHHWKFLSQIFYGEAIKVQYDHFPDLWDQLHMPILYLIIININFLC